jgi:hypothetical protein
MHAPSKSSACSEPHDRIESALARIRALVEERNPAPSFHYQVGRPATLYWWQDEPGNVEESNG